MKKKIIRRGLFCLLIVISYLILGTWMPFLYHKQPGDETQKNFHVEDLKSDTRGTEKAAYITDNQNAMEYRFHMCEDAKKEILFSTFDFNADEAGKDMMAMLLHAANRGVKVRMIVDGISGLLDVKGSPYFQALAANENITLKIYNPVNLLLPWKAECRMHDKYLITDDQMYVLGGRNTMNLFLGEYSGGKNEDTEVFVKEEGEKEGTSIEELQQYFEKIWEYKGSKTQKKKENKKETDAKKELIQRYEKVKELYGTTEADKFYQNGLMETNKITLLSNPIEAENKTPDLWYCLSEIMKTGQNISVYTPYVILSNDMKKDIKEICQHAENVEFFINDPKKGANPWGCTDYLNQKQKLLDLGLEIREYRRDHSLHTKNIVVDDRISIVGSMNLDMRSAYLDTELMLVLDSKDFNAKIRDKISDDKNYCKSIKKGEDYQYGSHYTEKDFDTKKKVMYQILRVLIRPIRCLL